MKWRKITKEEVLTAILEPEDIQDSINGIKNFYKHINEKLIKATYKEEIDKFVVITAIDKNK
jgi:flagellin-specific chaperone FliS